MGRILEADTSKASPSKDLFESAASILALDTDFRFIVEVDDDDSEDHSLMELAGDILEERLDNTR